jgi:PilZ domain
MDPFSKQVGEKNAQRRSQRVLVAVPISVVLARPNQKPISENTNTLVVSAHGALVLLALKLFAGDPVTLINPQTDEQQPARVVYLGPQQSDKQEIGVEFVKPSPLFWRIAFPPPDWTPGHEDAKAFAKRVPPQPKV